MEESKEEVITENTTSYNNEQQISQVETEHERKTEFTSEIFKIEIGNLPKIYSINHLKKLLLKLKLKPKKVKVIPHKNFAFVTFMCEEDRQLALKTLDSYEFKKKILTVKMAKALGDPIATKMDITKEQDKDLEADDTREEIENIDISTRLQNAVTPLWQKTYEQQKSIKHDAMKKVLRNLTKQLFSANLKSWVSKNSEMNEGLCCPLEDVVSSPITTAYRNKCEFTIGKGDKDQGKVVGFRLGLYKNAMCSVAEPQDCIHIPETMKHAAKILQEYINESSLEVFDPKSRTGFWKQLTVRTSNIGSVMYIVEVVGENMSKEELDAEIEKLTNSFRSETSLTSMYIDICDSSLNNADITSHHLLGNKHIFEELCGLTFRISPNAFFQVNTKAAEILYQTVREWSEVTKDTLVLDICCGTGTIGLSLAQLAKKVIGVELCQAAVEDAKFNATSNAISNVEFICGKAEDVIVETTKNLNEKSVVGIVDPPRPGCHGKVIQAIRRCNNLNRLIYISCSPASVIKDFVDLCRPESKRCKGKPFQIIKAVPVDLFPQTKHCELIMLFER